ncbi:MFS transporter [Sphingomonas qilianensis]|uniref:MFS transporter n=1 Tax=Sphingomonas qilianensis TaxID=1736690 RepID=A0ABU9XP16_9SPHN
MTNSRSGARLATRQAFLVSGFGLACWAPLVPLAKERLAIGDGSLGLLLLCLGLGSVAAMQLAGPLTSKLGARPAILVGGIGQAILLPFLAFMPTVPTMAVALLLFGAFLGVIEVGMNVHAVEVEKQAARPLMSGFHGLFSVGGFVGSMLLTAVLSMGISPITGAVTASVLMIATLALAAPQLIPTPRTEQAPLIVVPCGIVILLAALAAITFLTEGAMLDWGALLLSSKGLLPVTQAGLGYSVFAVAMTVGRLTGDAMIAKLGDRRTMLWGGLLSIVGYVVMLLAPVAPVALFGFLLIGLGASNVVPILFRQAGSQTVMPAGLAIASVTTIGYAGILAGPAGIGFLAEVIGLPAAFWLLTALLSLVPLCAKAATSHGCK